MKPETFTPGEQTATTNIAHAETGIRVRVYHERLRWGAYNIGKCAELAANIALELEDDEENRVQWVGTGTLHALLEVIRMASMDLHGTLTHVIGEDGQ
ncbi:MAG: hypothetical protein MZV65_43080 [Chromatiales bacterium]|nr:hypothetical protein [Chromatiales bacterium]